MGSEMFPIVLVVDDDPGQVLLVTTFLKKAGFRVISAPSGVAALAALEKAGEAGRGISLLVADLDMPGMTGKAFAAKMKKAYPDLKVLYVTSDPTILFQNRSELGPNEAFLEKPVSAPLLREAVNYLLRPAR